MGCRKDGDCSAARHAANSPGSAQSTSACSGSTLIDRSLCLAASGCEIERNTALYAIADLGLDADELARLAEVCAAQDQVSTRFYCRYARYKREQTAATLQSFVADFPDTAEGLESIIVAGTDVALPVGPVQLRANVAATDDETLHKLLQVHRNADGWVAEEARSAIDALRISRGSRVHDER